MQRKEKIIISSIFLICLIGLMWSFRYFVSQKTEVSPLELLPKSQWKELYTNNKTLGIGQFEYKQRCYKCHGIYGQGSYKGVNLIDDEWIYGSDENDILTRTLSTGTHSLKKVKETTSPSIDIQISSNFERLLYDLSGDSSYVDNLMNNLIKTGSYQLSESLLKEINSHFVSYSVSEAEVDNTIKEIYNKYQLVIDPHTAVGLASALKSSLEYKNTITLATAHPAKFKDTVSNIIKNDDFVTDKIKAIMELTENMVILENDDNIVKKYITDNI